MPKYSNRSKARLATVHSDLQDIFYTVIKYFDCSILCGHRNEGAQTLAFDSGFSKLQWPESLHNMTPSLAIDVAPYPVDWEDTDRMYYFAGFVKGIAIMKGKKIRAGCDWDSDNDLHDQSFIDLVHFEIVVNSIHKEASQKQFLRLV